MCKLDDICYDVNVTAGVPIDAEGNPDYDEIENYLAENASHNLWQAEDEPYHCYDCDENFRNWDAVKEHLAAAVLA